MDNGRLSLLSPRQIACQTLDNINKILKLVIQHMMTQLNSRQEIPSNGFYKGFNLNQVTLTR